MRDRSFILASLGLVWLTSCATFRQLVGLVADKPQLKLQQVELQSFSQDRMEMIFVLDAFNPNSFKLDVEKFEYQVSGLGLELGAGALDHPFVLEGKERSQLRLPFRVAPAMVLKIMKKYLSNPKELKILVRGHLFLNTALGRMDSQFEEEKSILKGVPGL